MEALIEQYAEFGLSGLVIASLIIYLYRKDRLGKEERDETAQRQEKNHSETTKLFTDSQKSMVENFTGALDSNTSALHRVADGMDRQMDATTRMTEVLHELKGKRS